MAGKLNPSKIVFVGGTAFRALVEQDSWEGTPEGDLIRGAKVTQSKEGELRFANFLRIWAVEPPDLKCEDSGKTQGTK